MFEVTCVGLVYNTANSGIRSVAKCQYTIYNIIYETVICHVTELNVFLRQILFHEFVS